MNKTLNPGTVIIVARRQYEIATIIDSYLNKHGSIVHILLDNKTKSLYEYNHWQNCHRLLPNDNNLKVQQQKMKMVYEYDTSFSSNVYVTVCTESCKCFEVISHNCELNE